MTGLRRRTVSLHDCRLAVEFPADPATERIVDVVLDGAPDAGRESDAAPLRIERVAVDRWVLHGAGPSAVQACSAGHLGHALMDALAERLISSCDRGLVFHAAACARAGRVILFPGPSGSGKSTLSASIVGRGWTLIGDEIAHVDSDRRVSSYPRPLAFKRDGAPLTMVMDGGSSIDSILKTPAATLVPSRLIGGVDRTGPGEIAACVFPARVAGRAPAMLPLSRAETALRLMALLVNARCLPSHGLPAVAGLARDVRGFRLVYEEARDVPDDWLATCSASASRQTSSASETPRSPCS